ncbi:MAG TPA: biotin transporter BioY [Rhabdochlamydiaceae bacterium]|jgi:biotin transport system substrate-specific component
MTTAQNTLELNMLGVRSWVKEVLIILGASIIISLFAPIAIPLPFTPVPLTTQVHVIIFFGALLGARRAALAVCSFLAQGAMGLPVFAGCKGGFVYLLGPTGGYLLSYIAAAFVIGFLMEKVFKRTTTNAFFAMCIGNAVVYLIGLPWLSLYCGWKAAFQLGLLPFIAGDFLKLVLATKLLRLTHSFSQRSSLQN